MPKTTAELAASKPGETAETNGFGSQERPLRPAGLYQLKNKAGEVVSTVIVKSHAKFGDGQAAAAERVGYEYVRPARPDEIKEIEIEVNPATPSSDEQKGILARLNALEKENADLKAMKVEEDSRTDDHSVEQSGSKEAAKAAAAENTAARLDDSTETATPDDADLRPEADEAQKAEEATDEESTQDETDSEQSSEAGSAQNDEAPSKGAEPATNVNNAKKAGK